MRFELITIFPGFFAGPLDYGVVSRAIRKGVVSANTHDLRAFTHDRHRTVDDRPFGGGEGMVLKAQPIFECAESIGITQLAERDLTRESVILLAAGGKPFTQTIAHELSKLERITMICGRYEGVDERVNTLLCDRELSVGDYVLSGGELGAAIILDAVTRLLPGVLGNADSARFESFGHSDEEIEHTLESPQATHGSGGLLDYPHYTRPAEFLGHTIPEVLANGDHAQVRKWRRQQQLLKTARNRPDLLAKADLSEEDRTFLAGL